MARPIGAFFIHIMEGTIRYMRTTAPLLLPLFRSANQERVLSGIFLADRRMSIQNLSEHLNIPYPTVHREVNRLLQAGLLEEEKVGNYRLIGPNKQSPYYRPLFELLEIAFGPVPLLRKVLQGVDGVREVVIFGSWAHRTLGQPGSAPEDIDVLVIGQPDVSQVYAACSSVSKKLGWPVNPTIMSVDEWHADTPFLRNVRAGGVLNVIDSSEPKARS